MHRRCCGFGTKEIHGPNLSTGRSQRKGGGNAATIGDPAGGYDGHPYRAGTTVAA
jgi:hypothetical protein